MNKNTLIGIIAIAIIVVGGFFWWQGAHSPLPAPSSDTGAQASGPSTATPVIGGTETVDTQGGAGVDVGIGDASAPVTVTYTANGFSPKTVTIKQGEKVTFVNQSGRPMWVASDPHPSHQGYSGTTRTQHCPDTAGTAFDQCATGNSYTFTFAKVGTWGYHNHADDGDSGTIVVTQ